jgi:hypothetical protein
MLKNPVSASQETQCVWKRPEITHKSNAFMNVKTDWVMWFKEAISVYCDNLTKHRKAVGSYDNGFGERVTGLLVTVKTVR